MDAGVFVGFVALEATLSGVLRTKDGSDTPVQADALPTFRVHGPNGVIENGTCSQLNSGNVTAATNATPIVITSADHGLTTGAYVTVAGVTGNTAANGTFTVTRVNDDTFELDGSTGNGAYVSGGTWVETGAYRYSISVLGADGYESGEVYVVGFDFAISSTQKSAEHSFAVT
jgi:hypothetical protein